MKKVRDIRSEADCRKFLPENAGEYREDLLDILQRMSTGYWPSIEIPEGWYGLIVDLNQKIQNIDSSYRIKNLSKKHGNLNIAIRCSSSEARLKEIMILVKDTVKKSKTTCESCAASGLSVIVKNGVFVLCDTCKKGRQSDVTKAGSNR